MLNWTIRTYSGAHPLELVDAKPLDPDNPDHLELVANVASVQRNKAKHAPMWDDPVPSIAQRLRGVLLEATVDRSVYALPDGGVFHEASGLVGHPWLGASVLDAVHDHIRSGQLAMAADALNFHIPRPFIGFLVEREEIKPWADRHGLMRLFQPVRSAFDWLDFWSQFPVIVDVEWKA